MSENAWLESELPSLLPAFLPKQRWFGGKAREIRAVDIEDAAWLADPSRRCALIVIGVSYADGATERYVMPLAFLGEETGLPVVGRFEHSDSRMWAVDAATDATTSLALLFRFTSPRDIPMLRGGRLRYGDADAAAEQGVARAAEGGRISALGAEQSNTSVRLDRTLVFKLFRKLEHGENPEVEVGRFLIRQTPFRAMPTLRGSLTYVAASGEPSTVGVLQDWIESHGDGWTHVVGRLRTPIAGDGESLRRDLFELGSTTADFHAALSTDTSDPAFVPEPVTAADLQAWRTSLLGRAARVFGLVEQCTREWAQHERQLAAALLDLRGEALALAETPQPTTGGGFHKIRVHGDYHLGQVLRTSSGFTIIDFEGEPARPLVERRLKHCALKDVAGMIRSFEYAVDAARQQGSDTTGGATLFQRLRESFLDGYLTSALAHNGSFLPRDQETLDAWIDFFEFEKALYEVEYEINNRPHWVRVPLQGILRILGSHI